MIEIKRVEKTDKDVINAIVDIHMKTFEGFFLTFLGRGFLRQMYTSYCLHEPSELYVAEEDGKPLGFVAYSADMSGLYKFMIKKKLIPFAWYALGGFFRRPSAFMRLVRAFLKPGESRREENYIELSSIGVSPEVKSRGVGSMLISHVKDSVDFDTYEYISLETDAENNELANHFYKKNGFVLVREYETREGRKMNEYRYGAKNEDTVS